MSERSEPAAQIQSFTLPLPEEPADLLLRHLHAARQGLSSREAARRLVQYGPNELRRRGGRHWPRELARQVTHPLALLLWVAAALSFAVGSRTVAVAVLLVILLNALFAFVQEMQAERAVEALAQYLPQHATVLRDGEPALIDAVGLVPGDIVVLAEGDRVAADIRLLSGAVDVDMSTLTGESVPVLRSAELTDLTAHRLDAPDLVFSVYAPPLQSLLGTAVPPARDLVLLLPYPLIVWGADELRRWLLRRRAATR
ncbi:HAD-IC family P-type ATPase [Kitasatospora sp. NPDC001132]